MKILSLFVVLIILQGCGIVSKKEYNLPKDSIIATAIDELEQYRWRLLNPERFGDVLTEDDQRIVFSGSFCAKYTPTILQDICSKHNGQMRGLFCVENKGKLNEKNLFKATANLSDRCDNEPGYRLVIEVNK